MTITDKLNRLVGLIESKGYPLSQFLRPPLSLETINSKSQSLPFDLPAEIIELYTWHDGIEENSEIPLFRDNRFLSWDEALEEYTMMCTYYVDDDINLEVDFRQSFPFAGFEGSLYVIPSEPQTSISQRPIINVFEGIDVYFPNLPTMLDTIHAWYQEGAYRITSTENGQVELDIDDRQEATIWARLNPGYPIAF